MYVKIEDNKLKQWSKWQFDGLFEIETDYEKFNKNPDNYAVIEGVLTDISTTPEFIAEKIQKAKEAKQAENTEKAKIAIENGYVTFKEAEFETNAQTVSDLTATMLMLQAQASEVTEQASRVRSNTNGDEESAENYGDTFNASEVTEQEQTEEPLTYTWLSKDDKAVELTVTDFVTLGNLIAEYKNAIWNTKYITFKTAIEQAETIADIEAIEIDYADINV